MKRKNIFFIFLFLVLFCAEHSMAQVNPKLAAKIKAELTGKSWPVYVSLQQLVKGALKSSVEEDLIVFTENAVVSGNLSAQGYAKSGSGYKVKLNADGDTYVWEAVMLHENQKDIVLLKGELKNGVMTGVMIYQVQGSAAKTYNFTTISQE